MLDSGPVVHGWDDARWTPARVAELIERRFEISASAPPSRPEPTAS
jgi:putative transposase